MGVPMSPREYELLTRRLMRLISERSPLATARLEHDVKGLRGRSTGHQVDVLWEFVAPDGSPRRVLIECKRWKDPLDQGRVFAFKAVVDDLDTPELPTTGVMVTTNGYQSGARDVAGTYGVEILQLREPTAEDRKDRVERIEVAVDVRVPYIGPDVEVEATELLIEQPAGPVQVDQLGLLLDDGGSVLLQDFLWSEVLGGFDGPPVAPHRVTREFPAPWVLTLNGEALMRISSVSATVGEVSPGAVPVALTGEVLAWMIANILDGTRLWFTDTDRVHVSDDRGGAVVLPTDVVLGRPTAGPTP